MLWNFKLFLDICNFSADFTLLWKCETISLHCCCKVHTAVSFSMESWTTRFREWAKQGRWCLHTVLMESWTTRFREWAKQGRWCLHPVLIESWTTRFREWAKQGRWCLHPVLLIAEIMLLALSVTEQMILSVICSSQS